MCEHCGCRGVQPIADLMDEHYEMLDLSGEIRRRLDGGDRAAASSGLAELGRLLLPHARREERGVFAALREKGEFVEEVADLESDHLAFDEALSELDPEAADFGVQVHALLADLSVHIDRENVGIFPVTVVSLGAEGWEIVARAHAEEGDPQVATLSP
jgi:hypothetical protein